MSVLNHKEDVHFCTREWACLSHFWRASANMGKTTCQLWARRLAKYGRDSPLLARPHTNYPMLHTNYWRVASQLHCILQANDWQVHFNYWRVTC